MQNAAPLEIYRLPITGRSMPEVSTVTSTWRSGAAPTPQRWRHYWSGGFWPAWKFASNAREERRQHRAHRGAARNFCVHIPFTAHNSMKGSSHGGTCKCIRSVVSDAQDKGREAVEAVSEVRDNVAYAIDKSLKKRPYTTLGLTLALGFLLGAMWAR